MWESRRNLSQGLPFPLTEEESPLQGGWGAGIGKHVWSKMLELHSLCLIPLWEHSIPTNVIHPRTAAHLTPTSLVIVEAALFSFDPTRMSLPPDLAFYFVVSSGLGHLSFSFSALLPPPSTWYLEGCPLPVLKVITKSLRLGWVVFLFQKVQKVQTSMQVQKVGMLLFFFFLQRHFKLFGQHFSSFSFQLPKVKYYF